MSNKLILDVIQKEVMSCLPLRMSQYGVPEYDRRRLKSGKYVIELGKPLVYRPEQKKDHYASPVVGFRCHPSLQPRPTTQEEMADWWSECECANFVGGRSGNNPLLVRPAASLTRLRRIQPHLISFGLVFNIGYSWVSAGLMNAGVETLCDSPEGRYRDDERLIRIQSERKFYRKFDHFDLTDATQDVKRLRWWAHAVTEHLVVAHVRTAAQHRKGILSILNAEKRAQTRFESLMSAITTRYEALYPGRNPKYTWEDVVNRTGFIQKLTSNSLRCMRTQSPDYWKFKDVQRLAICLDLGEQLWLIITPGNKKSILMANNYTVAIANLKARPIGEDLRNRLNWLMQASERVCKPPVQPDQRVRRKRVIIVQQESPAE